jgi:hypothetical protein
MLTALRLTCDASRTLMRHDEARCHASRGGEVEGRALGRPVRFLGAMNALNGSGSCECAGRAWTKVQYAHTVTHESMPSGYARMPLIMLAARDPVWNGLIASLNRL